MHKNILLFFAISIFQITTAQTDYFQTVEHYRDSVNHEFSDPEHTILPKKDLAGFHGLEFYPIAQEYVVAAKFKRIRFSKKFEMPTSTDRLPVYKKYGRFTFELNGKENTLYVYQNVASKKDLEYGDYLFLPFNDATNGKETYGGGRFMDVRISKLDKITTLDFNLCYNPYCAYNSRYSCPIPPLENSLDIGIEAGVKKYH